MVRFEENICFLNFGFEALLCKCAHKVKLCYADTARTVSILMTFCFYIKILATLWLIMILNSLMADAQIEHNMLSLRASFSQFKWILGAIKFVV